MSRFVDVSALAQREGLTVVEQLKEGYDHDVYLVERGGMRQVLKTIVRPELRPNLEREVAYCTLLATLAAGPPDRTVRAGAVRAYGDGWVLRDHVAGLPLLREDDLGAPGPLRRVARALADLDRLSPDPCALPPAYRDAAGQPRCGEGHRVEELGRWVRTVADGGALPPGWSADGLTRALGEGRREVQPGFEFFDVELDDFLDLPDGLVGVVDLEFAHLHGRRHYDVASLAGKLAVRHGAPEAAVALLAAYAEAAAQAPDALARSAGPVLAETLLSQLFDAVESDDPERTARARELLGRCLEGGLPALLQGGRLAA